MVKYYLVIGYVNDHIFLTTFPSKDNHTNVATQLNSDVATIM